MKKKYIVRLTDEERDTCREAVRKLVGTGQRVRRAQMLLKADADGPGGTDERIAEAYSCRRQTVENVRRRFVEDGFEGALERKRREAPPRIQPAWTAQRRRMKIDDAHCKLKSVYTKILV